MAKVDIDIKQIMKVIPHRIPFLLIDRIIDIEEDSVVAIKNVTMNEPQFLGHFPEYPIMPGVLIVEAMAQAGAYLLLSRPGSEGKLAVFAGIDSVRFRKQVLPGDTLRFEVQATKAKGMLFKMKGVVKVEDQVVCEGELMCSVVSTGQDKKPKAAENVFIHSSAKIGQNVTIGANSYIGEEVVIGDNTEIGTGVMIKKWTKIGSNCKIMHGTTIAMPPQDLKYKDERGDIEIGDNCTIREYVTIHLPTGTGKKTTIGNNCMLMTNVHIPHNATIGNNVIIASFVGLGGHSEIDDNVIIGGMTGLHQFVRIGKMAMIGGQSKIVQDVPPFMIADGNPGQIRGLNIIGLQRRGVSFEAQVELKKAYKILYRSKNNLTQAVSEMKRQCKPLDEVKYLIEFLEKETDRGILKRSEQEDDMLFPDIPELGI